MPQEFSCRRSPPPTPLPPEQAGSPHRPLLLSRWFDIIGPVLALFGVFLFFYFIIGSSFATFFNLQTILRQTTVTCVAALGATFIIISAGIDLSIGSSVALVAMIVATLLKTTRPDPANPDSPIELLATYPLIRPHTCAAMGLAAGLHTGLFNGTIKTTLRLAPFIVTLGSMMIFRGLTEAISVVAVNARSNWLLKLLAVPDLPPWAESSSAKPLLQWLFLAPGVWITLALALLMALLLNYFRFGRHTVAIGSNEQTARLCGIPVNRTKILIYCLGGFFAGAAGIMQYARQRQGSPAANIGLELDVIAACVIGGASLNGGKGSILGTIVGSLIMTVIASGCSQVPIPGSFPHWIGEGVGLQPFVQKIVTGCIIIIAVALDNLRQRKPA